MIQIQITTHGELLVNLETLPGRITEAVAASLQKSVQEIWEKLVGTPAIAALEAKTGWSLFEHGVDRQGSLLIGYVSQRQESKGWYDIYPTKVRLLRFIGKDGTQVFTGHVFHPPFPMERYVEPTFEEAIPMIEVALDAAIEAALRA